MADSTLIYPIIIIFTGALVAALFGLPALNHRLKATRLSWILALAPLSAFLLLLTRISPLQANLVYTWQVRWLPSINLNAGLYFDSLSALFALLITFIGILVVIYAGQYFKKDSGAWRFFNS